VVNDVDPAGNLVAHNLRDGGAHGLLELGAARAGGFLLGEQKLHHLRRARQAAGVGRQNAAGAALHRQKPRTTSVTCSTLGGNAKQCPTSLRHSWKSADSRKSLVWFSSVSHCTNRR